MTGQFCWRASHNFPLIVFQRILRKRAKQIDPGAIVAKRLKRFSSVMNKLSRESQMKLSQMQDLGGCRAIVTDVATVYRLYQTYLEINPSSPPEWTVKCYDYIKHPKPDGYRGIHVVGRYLAPNEKGKPWDGHRIEIQLRSKLQHAFATAVETVTTFTRLPLKFGGGPPDWRRFFSLMGSVLVSCPSGS
jgi:ppGpp synthetase/RelA/SpoT-type nucleotidyltranferase